MLASTNVTLVGYIMVAVAAVLFGAFSNTPTAYTVDQWPTFVLAPYENARDIKSNSEVLAEGRAGGGPETVIVSGFESGAYLLCEDGDVKFLKDGSDEPSTVARVGGRPL